MPDKAAPAAAAILMARGIGFAGGAGWRGGLEPSGVAEWAGACCHRLIQASGGSALTRGEFKITPSVTTARQINIR